MHVFGRRRRRRRLCGYWVSRKRLVPKRSSRYPETSLVLVAPAETRNYEISDFTAVTYSLSSFAYKQFLNTCYTYEYYVTYYTYYHIIHTIHLYLLYIHTYILTYYTYYTYHTIPYLTYYRLTTNLHPLLRIALIPNIYHQIRLLPNKSRASASVALANKIYLGRFRRNLASYNK